MKKWLRPYGLVLFAAVVCVNILPGPAAAAPNPPAQVELHSFAPTVAPLVTQDFTDTDFERADQPECGRLRGRVILLIGGLVAFLALLLLVVMVLFTI